MLKEHGGVYLERRLYTALKNEFPELSRADFEIVLDELLQEGYIMERGLIKPQLDKDSTKSSKSVSGKRTGKGTSDTQRIPDKRL
jgi:hypothetical protein